MAGARALWVANGMKKEQFGKPIIAIANSFTQFVPGHTHLHEAGQLVKKEIENRHLSKTFFIFFGFSLAYFPIFCYYTFVMDFNRKSNDRLRRCYDG